MSYRPPYELLNVFSKIRGWERNKLPGTMFQPGQQCSWPLMDLLDKMAEFYYNEGRRHERESAAESEEHGPVGRD